MKREDLRPNLSTFSIEMFSHFQLTILTKHRYVTGELTGCNSIKSKYVQWNIRHTSPKFAVTKKSSTQGFTFLLTYYEGKTRRGNERWYWITRLRLLWRHSIQCKLRNDQKENWGLLDKEELTSCFSCWKGSEATLHTHAYGRFHFSPLWSMHLLLFGHEESF